MAARPTKIGGRDKTGKWKVLWTDNKYRAKGEKPKEDEKK